MHDAAASVLTDQFSDLLKRLPPGVDLDRLALETKAIQRKREVVDGASLLRIALARGPGGLSLRQTSAWASMLGIAELSNPGVKYRLNQATAFLQAVVEHLLAAKIPGADLRWPDRILRLADATCVSKPGSTGTDWRVHGVFDLGRGGFSHLELTDAQGAEALDRGAPHPGEIRIGDRNYARAPVLRRFRAESGGNADFITRLGWNALQLTNPAGKLFDLIGYLQCLPADASPHEVSLRASVGRDEPALAVRLIVQRKAPEAAEATRSNLRRAAARKGKALDPRSLIAAEFMILATSLPKCGYSAKAVLAVYRLRWQIELAFKRLKSLLHIDRLPTWTEHGSRSWLYAHLILALLCDDLSQDFLESSP
jgi:DDE family transposase